jgi:hypothetical protein
MARMIPALEPWQEAALSPRSEAEFYAACRRLLGPEYLVIHSQEFIGKGRVGRQDGEADFLVFSKHHGMIAIEVKGGGIGHDPIRDEWFSTDRMQTRHPIKDPFAQAKRCKHEIGGYLLSNPRWKAAVPNRFGWAHAVFFPDVASARMFAAPARPVELIGVRSDLDKLAEWFERVFAYWKSEGPPGTPIGEVGLRLAEELLCPRIEARCLLAPFFKQEEEHRLVLTKQQARLLRSLDTNARVAIKGGAGTGKTILALEKARELADGGRKTLLLCYNRPLGDHLNASVGKHPNLFAMTYHQLCEFRCALVRQGCGRDLLREMAVAYPKDDKWLVQYPEALAESVDLLPERFGGIVVDEGQDFAASWWSSILMLLHDPDKDPVIAFYDPNQCLYNCSDIPFKESIFALTINCRNTEAIHKAAYRFYEGTPTDPPEIAGTPIELYANSDLATQAATIRRRVKELMDAGVAAEDITVLIGMTDKGACYRALRTLKLAGKVRWAFEGHQQRDVVRVDSVRRFKGLESAVVVLWQPSPLKESERGETLYVGITRAKSLLVLVGASEAIEGLCVNPDRLGSTFEAP